MASMGTAGLSSTATGVSLVVVSVPNKDVGHRLARSLVDSKLAACVQMIPGGWHCRCTRLSAPSHAHTFPPAGVESVFFWEGKVQQEQELLLHVKTRRALVPEVEAHVRALHPYSEPEVTSFDVAGGSASFLQWVLDSTKEEDAAAASPAAEGEPKG